MLGQLKDSRGFTFIELLMVFIVLGIMAQMALTFMIDLRSRSSDVMAISDGKNLFTSVRNNFVNLDDVNYAKINGSDIGVETVAGDSRPPVFTLSPGVQFRDLAGSSGTPDKGFFEVYLYHVDGTDMGTHTTSGKKEFHYVASEVADTYILATF